MPTIVPTVALLTIGMLAAASPNRAPLWAAVAHVRGRTSIVFSGVVAPQSATVSTTTPTKLVVHGKRNGEGVCVAVRLAAPPADTRGVSRISIDCPSVDRFTARIDLRQPARISTRGSGDRLYIDLTPEPGPAARSADQTSIAGHSSSVQPVSATNGEVRSTTYSDAVALAQRGDVLGLEALIATTVGTPPSTQSDDDDRGRALRRLLNEARKRRLELDRALFAKGAVDRRR